MNSAGAQKKPVKITIGDPISADTLSAFSSVGKSMMDFLRNQTYALSPDCVLSSEYGFKFEEQYRS